MLIAVATLIRAMKMVGDEDDDGNASEEREEKRKEVEGNRRIYAEYILNVGIELSEARGVPVPKERLSDDIADTIKFQLKIVELWCEVSDPVKSAPIIICDPHSLGPLRVIGSISNSEDFAKAYNCPVDSPMNPKEKCSIWK